MKLAWSSMYSDMALSRLFIFLIKLARSGFVYVQMNYLRFVIVLMMSVRSDMLCLRHWPYTCCIYICWSRQHDVKCFSDIFNQGKWTTSWACAEPSLESLASRLPETCLKPKAENTRTKYSGAFNRFCKWCSHYNISSLPASDYNVSLYLIHLSDVHVTQ